MPKYYFVMASKKFLLCNEPTEEILRERTNYYNSIKKPIDFWLVKNPKFLGSLEVSEISQKLNVPTAAIISTNSLFITWLKLRLGFVVTGIFTKDIL
uniref:Ycf54 n=1 Tax=Hildenbrandia rubra TaxID=31481 RepID=A0A1C9CG43_9FLOR|nr:hypothetical protein Hrub_100 [Hildenbrandia rubra]AOM67344.1 hypothetical protein Hrub_100 [Hildenbrandia rubra]